MKYYEADDLAFQKLRELGKRSWDEQSDPEASFDNFVMRPFLEESLSQMGRPLAGLHALEMGCGTGPICCFLTAKGMCVHGIDVSPTAIEMARQNAAERGLDVQFDIADICELPAEQDQYDLIVDGHCLHCLVADEDRWKALSAIHGLLRPAGLFLTERMVWHPGMVVGEKYRYDEDGVLWLRVDDPAGVEDLSMMNGCCYRPHRRISTAEAIEDELKAAGFDMRWKRMIEQKGESKPMLMQIRCGRR